MPVRFYASACRKPASVGVRRRIRMVLPKRAAPQPENDRGALMVAAPAGRDSNTNPLFVESFDGWPRANCPGNSFTQICTKQKRQVFCQTKQAKRVWRRERSSRCQQKTQAAQPESTIVGLFPRVTMIKTLLFLLDEAG